jgi:hypothetical protein
MTNPFRVGEMVVYLTHEHNRLIGAPDLVIGQIYIVDELGRWSGGPTVGIRLPDRNRWWYNVLSFEKKLAAPPFCVGSLR